MHIWCTLYHTQLSQINDSLWRFKLSTIRLDYLDERNKSIPTRLNETMVSCNFCRKIAGLLKYSEKSTRIFGEHYFKAFTMSKVNEHIWFIKSTEKTFFTGCKPKSDWSSGHKQTIPKRCPKEKSKFMYIWKSWVWNFFGNFFK